MKIEHKYHISSVRCSPQILQLLCHNISVGLSKELELLGKHVYPQNNQGLFNMDERTWVGLLNNAIVKGFGDDVATLQEFGVYNHKRFVGRADLLAVINVGPENFVNLLFEAKQYTQQGIEGMLDDATDYLNGISEQCCKYYDAEKWYYESNDTFIIPIVFANLRGEEIIRTALAYFAESHTVNREADSSDFCYLYYSEEDWTGAWVYGKYYFRPKI